MGPNSLLAVLSFLNPRTSHTKSVHTKSVTTLLRMGVRLVLLNQEPLTSRYTTD